MNRIVNIFSDIKPLFKMNFMLLLKTKLMIISSLIYILVSIIIESILYATKNMFLTDKTNLTVITPIFWIATYMIMGITILIFISYLFVGTSSKNLMNLENRYGINPFIMFFVRFLVLITIIYSIIIVNLIISLFYLIGNTGGNNSFYYYVIRPQLILMFIVLFFTSINILLFLSINKIAATVINTFLVIILCFGGFFTFAFTQLINSYSMDDSATQAKVNAKIKIGYDFYNEFHDDETYNALFKTENFKEKMNEHNMNMLYGNHYYWTNNGESRWDFIEFYQMGQVLNLDDKDNFILEDTTPALFDLFNWMYEELKTEKSKYEFKDTPFMDKKLTIPSMDWVFEKLKTDQQNWDKYSTILLYAESKLDDFYRLGLTNDLYYNPTNYKRLGSVYEMGLDDSDEQKTINEFYTNVPEFLILAQLIRTHWTYSMELPFTDPNNMQIFSQGKNSRYTFENYNNIASQNRNAAFLNIFGWMQFLNSYNLNGNTANGEIHSTNNPILKYKPTIAYYDLSEIKDDMNDWATTPGGGYKMTDESYFLNHNIYLEKSGSEIYVCIYITNILFDLSTMTISYFLFRRKLKN